MMLRNFHYPRRSRGLIAPTRSRGGRTESYAFRVLYTRFSSVISSAATPTIPSARLVVRLLLLASSQSPMPAAQAMAADKVASVSRGVREVSISSTPPAAAAAPSPAPAASQGGVEESKDQSQEQSCSAGGGEGEDDIDENDPLWKVSRR